MKLTASLLIIFALLNSVAVAEWPLHQSFYGASGGPGKTFFDSHGRYLQPNPIYPPAFELHQANGISRTLPNPSQPLPESHDNARHHRNNAAHKP
jgi:hypothetical protein